MTPCLFALLLQVGQYRPPLEHTTPLRNVVRLTLTTDRDSYYPGERFSIKIAATNFSDQPIQGHFASSTAKSDFVLLHSDPGAMLQPIAGLANPDAHWASHPRALQPGESLGATVAVSVTDPWERPNVGRAILMGMGTHRFKVEYSDTAEPNGLLESETITVEVVSPPPDEAAAAAAFTPSLGYISQLDWGEGFISIPLQAAAEDFIQNFPNSRYTAPLRSGLKNWLDYRTRMKWTNDEEKARLNRLRTSDLTGPGLAVSPSISTLWPPNKKMASVAMSVTASDDSGAVPAIKLVSITCNDGCNASADVTGAAFGTDDRAFMLRADRTGNGNGRTYVITYEAADAAGNKTTVTASVVVPHDQGHE